MCPTQTNPTKLMGCTSPEHLPNRNEALKLNGSHTDSRRNVIYDEKGKDNQFWTIHAKSGGKGDY
jgi:hypothetical protein